MRPRLLAVDHLEFKTANDKSFKGFNEATAVSRGSLQFCILSVL